MEKMSASFFFSFCSSFLVIFRSDAPPWGQEQRPSARRHWSDRRRDYFFFFEMIGMKLPASTFFAFVLFSQSPPAHSHRALPCLEL